MFSNQPIHWYHLNTPSKFMRKFVQQFIKASLFFSSDLTVVMIHHIDHHVILSDYCQFTYVGTRTRLDWLTYFIADDLSSPCFCFTFSAEPGNRSCIKMNLSERIFFRLITSQARFPLPFVTISLLRWSSNKQFFSFNRTQNIYKTINMHMSMRQVHVHSI